MATVQLEKNDPLRVELEKAQRKLYPPPTGRAERAPAVGEIRGRPIPNTAPASELESTENIIKTLLDMNRRRLVTGGSLLDVPTCVESVWGDGHQSLWAKGEPFILAGPEGVGKTTSAQQLALKLIGIGEPSLFGFTVSGPRRVLYVACDRPAQVWRSFSRMVSEDDRAILDKMLVLWRGPLPFDLATEPEALLALAARAECDVTMLDSVKDVAAELSKEETGLGLNRAFQLCCSEGVDVAALHHQRKAQAGAAKPRYLADVYGSRWLTAGAGSVVMLWGDAGDPVVELTHLKQPDETIGPLQIVHDHLTGTSTVVDHVDAFTVVARSARGVTATDVAQALYGDETRNSREKARRQLDRLVGEDKIHREDGARGGTRGGNTGREPARYYPISLLRQGGSDAA